MGCPPAISNQSKSELRGTCVAFFFSLYHGKDGVVRHQKEKSKSREMYNNNKATRTTAIKVFSLFCPPTSSWTFQTSQAIIVVVWTVQLDNNSNRLYLCLCIITILFWVCGFSGERQEKERRELTTD